MAWIHIVKGSAEVNGTKLAHSSTASIATGSIELSGQSGDAEILPSDAIVALVLMPAAG